MKINFSKKKSGSVFPGRIQDLYHLIQDPDPFDPGYGSISSWIVSSTLIIWLQVKSCRGRWILLVIVRKRVILYLQNNLKIRAVFSHWNRSSIGFIWQYPRDFMNGCSFLLPAPPPLKRGGVIKMCYLPPGRRRSPRVCPASSSGSPSRSSRPI